MSRRAWARLDNASNIFLAARSEVDPKVFRISAEMDHEVDAELLQRALETVYDRYPLYHSVLRRGVFWYYLQASDLRPVVESETLPTCAPIYRPDRRTLLFRVLHHRRRIALEIFHALSDGTGALWFVSDLVTEYVRLRHPAPGGERSEEGTSGKGPRVRPLAELPEPVTDPVTDPGPLHELEIDGFALHFRGRSRGASAGTAAEGVGASDASTGESPGQSAPTTAQPTVPPTVRRSRTPRGRVHRVRGTRTPDNRPRLVELTAPADPVLALARAEGVSPTAYLTAVFFESIRRTSSGRAASRPFAASVPVNLRQFFPSTSARNFFATVRIEHVYGRGPDDIGSVARNLERQFRPKAGPEALERRLRRLVRFERMPALRIVPRPLKDVLLNLINRVNNRGLTVAISNLGRVTLPAEAEPRVGRMLFHVSAVRPQFCAMSHAGMLAISFTSPFVENDHVREFARVLTAHGIPVTVAAARVTEEELAESGADSGDPIGVRA